MTIPFFSIGVTTFNRRQMLSECLASIRQQTFSDFEVIVGNDYSGETLSCEVLRNKDPRIRFVNHPRNLGELANMNSLLAMSRGRYFTWLADDDQYSPNFLEAVHAALHGNDFPSCAFTSYFQGAAYPDSARDSEADAELVPGATFLHRYLTGQWKAVGCYGVFDREYIGRTGGIEELSPATVMYSDNQLAIRAGLLEKVAYINAPLVFYRAHEGSIADMFSDLTALNSAHEGLCRKGLAVFEDERICADLHAYLFLLLRWCVRDFSRTARRLGSIDWRQAAAHLSLVFRYVRRLRGSPLCWRATGVLVKAAFRMIRLVAWTKLPRRSRSQEGIA